MTMKFHSHHHFRSKVTSLKLQLHACKTPSPLDKKGLVSRHCINEIVTEDNIKETLHGCSITDRGLSEFICSKAKAVFLILVQLSKLKAIVKFKEYGFTDTHLPIGIDNDAHGNILVKSLAIGSGGDEILRTNLPAFDEDEWTSDSSEIINFCEAQWAFLAPVFTENQYRYEFHTDQILPFTSKEDERGGGFSKVFKVEIHAEHFQTVCRVTGSCKSRSKTFKLIQYRHGKKSATLSKNQ